MSKVLEINNRKFPLNKPICTVSDIDCINASITYDEFYSRYLLTNTPCIFGSFLTENWPCRKLWSIDGAPDFDALSLLYGECTVPIADCNKKYYNSQYKMDMKMAEYLDYWKQCIDNKYPASMPLLYLKDWHCRKQFPNAPAYETPKYFLSDWLNEYYVFNPELDDDYMFVYMGPKGTWTPLHADVFASYSWSTNVTGRKRWLLFPPGQEEFLRDSTGNLAYDATSDELDDRVKYPAYDKRIVKPFDIIQESGETIFIPSGWHHQVWNMEDTISVNHNWINACNIRNVWLALKKELSSVMKEVEDCADMEDWNEHCQLMLKASYGMDYIQFYDFISFIAYSRLKMIADAHIIADSRKFLFSTNHCLFDLDAIRLVLIDFITNTEEQSVYSMICPRQDAHKLLNKILSVLQLHYAMEQQANEC